VAEASKLLENIYRAVNIALVNELKMCFDRRGIERTVVDCLAARRYAGRLEAIAARWRAEAAPRGSRRTVFTTALGALRSSRRLHAECAGAPSA
jgi:hypothetical protein